MSPRWPPDPNIHRGRSVVHDIQIHLVFVTKYRRGVLDGQMLTACGRVMRDLCAQMGAELREFNGDDDHVHLLVRYPPSLAVSTLVNRLKGVSAHYLRKEFIGRIDHAITQGRLWSPSYLAASSGAPPSIIWDYIQNQKQPAPDHPDNSPP